MWDAQENLVGNPEGKTNPRHRWENNWNWVVPRILWWHLVGHDFIQHTTYYIYLLLYISLRSILILPQTDSRNIIFSTSYQFYFNTCKIKMDKSLQMPLELEMGSDKQKKTHKKEKLLILRHIIDRPNKINNMNTLLNKLIITPLLINSVICI
jgi:hypothetical protein